MAKWGSCDFDELKKLQQNVARLQQTDMDAFCQSCVKGLAARLLAYVIPATPVGKYAGETGKKGGTLRRGWTAKSETQAQGGGAVGAAAYAAGMNVAKVGNTYQVEIVNPVHYASYVEYGHRQTPGRYVPAIGKRLVQGWAKGRYMLTISEEKLKAMTPVILERKLKETLREVFDV